MEVWWKRGGLGLVVTAILAGGLATLGASPAAAVEPSPVSNECVYDGTEYSEGAIIHINGDVYIICKKGKWETWNPEPPEPPEPREDG